MHKGTGLGTPVCTHTLSQEHRETEMQEISRQSGDHALPGASKLENHTATPTASAVLPSVPAHHRASQSYVLASSHTTDLS